MRLQFIYILFFLSTTVYSQQSKMNKFKALSCPEKCWVILHPFVAKKALEVSENTRVITAQIMKERLLVGDGSGGQVDAFRHAFWMANLTLEIGWRRAKSLGRFHEKGNYRDYKKRRLEDEVIPDKISSEMDLFNNNVGIEIGKITPILNLKSVVIIAVKEGKCKSLSKIMVVTF